MSLHARTAAALTVGLIAAAVFSGAVGTAPSATASVLLRTVIPHDTAAGIGKGPMAIAVRDDAHRAYVANNLDGTVTAIDTLSNSVIAVLPHDVSAGIGNLPQAVAIDPSRAQVYVVGSGTIAIIDSNMNRVTKVITTGDGMDSVAVDSAAARAYVTDYSNDTVIVIDTNTNTIDHVIAHDLINGIGNNPSSVAVDPATRQVYVTNDSDSISVIDTTTEEVTAVIPTPAGGSPRSIAIDTELQKAYAIDFFHRSLVVLDTTTNKIVGSVVLGGELKSVAIDSQSHQIFVSRTRGDGITVLDSRTDKITRVVPAGPDTGVATFVEGVAVDPVTSQLFVANYGDNSVAALSTSATQPLVRLSGADRFEVSAAVSYDGFNPGVPVAYIAAGGTFADALSGSAIAGAQRGPVLLVQKSTIPDAVAKELQRLKPRSIVVLGGIASIDATVESTLSAFSPSVRRVAGADRYEVSAALSQGVAPRAPVVYVASGEVFPDALSASAADGSQNAPVLLVQRNAVPGAVATELARLKPGRIVLVGGPNTVSDDVARTLGGVAPTTRIAGADRFSVSAQVSASAFATGLDTVYVASGAVFPDALSGSPAAIVSGAPVLLVSAAGVPTDVANELDRLKPKRIVVLGGTTTIPDAVLTELRTHLS
ncbi:cell wall-binding repeat-containing protein [Herbiconiux sp. YIM B11900]|uniref:cell wall-binding repeat-containing protein n=1 Tax=Herbiconiux sp. YIM B11900 TaxID=3404131 RepID=UPI003F87C551